ncbi:MAG: hypothetical protein M3507_00775 [Actinomycetota bacterium]|jgi:hypothetical protein|nr:hypothetical protein [Actinomycetota bacterium]
MWVVLVVMLAVVLGVGLYAGLMSSGIVPRPQWEGSDDPDPDADRRTSYRSLSGSRASDSGDGLFGIFPRVPHPRELPQGCLLALIVAAALWFIGWTVLLVLAIGLLRSLN